jgi:hypothetical protein
LNNVSYAAKYAMLFFVVAGKSHSFLPPRTLTRHSGASLSTAVGIAFLGGNVGPQLTRAAAMGLFFTFGNSGGLIASVIYPAETAPAYIEG